MRTTTLLAKWRHAQMPKRESKLFNGKEACRIFQTDPQADIQSFLDAALPQGLQSPWNKYDAFLMIEVMEVWVCDIMKAISIR